MNSNSQLVIRLSIGVAATLVAAGAASAGTWAETGPGFGGPPQPDAGNLIGDPNTNITDGFGPLDLITGHHLNGADKDLYQIRITDPANFFAETSGAASGHNLALALFDASGNGVVANYDKAADDTNARLDNTRVTTPGLYYLLVYGEIISYPAGPGGFIWTPPPSSATGLVGQLAPNAGAGALSVYNFDFGRGFFASNVQIPYTVSLGGSGFAIPAPASVALLGMGGLLAGRRRR
ncbi:MAG: hypothetical protein JSR77_13555 [Planctomycetes bacterium]|nr:hypothetical protein [Planctomycetota bacterium]